MSDVNSVALAEEAVVLPEFGAQSTPAGTLRRLIELIPGVLLLAVIGFAANGSNSPSQPMANRTTRCCRISSTSSGRS
jgi:hypothetical protein